jgi:hypothetical protein
MLGFHDLVSKNYYSDDVEILLLFTVPVGNAINIASEKFTW